ncbi:group I intron-associated PD-(D/E)XK endonuclease [Bacillus sp. 7894-2]|uniref:group I intron-associated PD-(D/E)XK endonuclease n=1 Tax=Bacillus sp. 7894-2 TaxID=2021695 RepID=UPI000BA6FE37|nr:group I intron-associated PD-(D/E)XK endonuclease [Bacillus sp. 7894-2]PAE24025.1 hypothetical protein CHI10_14565 [Bacillus sp. 7894-2]
MAHETQVKGTISELTAAMALLSNGWEVSFPAVDEVYDLVIRDPLTNEFKTAQVKTIRRREDRGNEMVVYSKKGNGEAYTPQDSDYIIGVEGQDVYMFECSGKREYWAKDSSAAKRWIRFTNDEWVEPTGVAQ